MLCVCECVCAYAVELTCTLGSSQVGNIITELQYEEICESCEELVKRLFQVFQYDHLFNCHSECQSYQHWTMLSCDVLCTAYLLSVIRYSSTARVLQVWTISWLLQLPQRRISHVAQNVLHSIFAYYDPHASFLCMTAIKWQHSNFKWTTTQEKTNARWQTLRT